MNAVAHGSLSTRRQPYPWAGAVSIGLHATLLLVAVLVASRQPPKIVLDQKPIAAKLVKLGKPRDNLLPVKETAPPPPPVTAPPAPVPVAAPPPPVKPAPSTAAPSKPTPKPASAERAPPPDPTRKLDDVMKRFKSGAIVGAPREEVGQLDGDPDGDAEEAAEGERYLALVKRQIQQRYQVPATIPETERLHLVAVLRLRIEKNGRLAGAEVVQASTNPVFDAALESAVAKVSSLPPPPPHLSDLLASEGIDIRFRP